MQFWPMRTLAAQDPIHGHEYLPFDQHVRKGKHLLSGNAYLTNEAYRQYYRDSRITPESLTNAFQRIGLHQDQQNCIRLENRLITASHVWWLHLTVGFEPLEPALLERELSDHGSSNQFHQNLPKESRQRIITRTIEECELCREYPEKAYLANLWKTSLSILELNESQGTPRGINHWIFPSTDPDSLNAKQTMSGWVESLTGVGLVAQINDLVRKWVMAFLDEEVAESESPQHRDGFYYSWKQMVQNDDSDSFFGIKDLSQRVKNLPIDPEDTIAASLNHLGISQEQWREYLACHLSLSPGWMQYSRWLGAHPDYHAQSKHPIDSIQYLAVRMFYEMELTQIICQQEWGIDATVPSLMAYWNDRLKALVSKESYSTNMRKQQICRDAWRFFHLAQFLELSPIDVLDLSCDDAQTLLKWIDDFPLVRHGLVWLEAYEESFRENI